MVDSCEQTYKSLIVVVVMYVFIHSNLQSQTYFEIRIDYYLLCADMTRKKEILLRLAVLYNWNQPSHKAELAQVGTFFPHGFLP